MGREEKPKLNIEQQIERLSEKGIKFDLISKEEAIKYLTDNNNYFKLTAYRKTFPKHCSGENWGKYIDLDFAQLKDLAIIDMRLRYALLHLALDVEHYAKVRLIKAIADSPDDGYDIVENFISSLADPQREAFDKEIERNRDNPYCGDIIRKYDGEYPVWAFVEVVPFGRFVAFYKYCANYFDDQKMVDEYFLLLSAKELRNATAHSNCILNDLSPRTSQRQTNHAVNSELSKIPGITKEIRRRKMSNARIQQIITLLYAHKRFVTSTGVHEHQCEALHDVADRMFRNISYYANNDTISTTFGFVKSVIDNWFPIAYNINTQKK